MKSSSWLFAMLMLASSGVVQAREPMAVFGEAYQGPKTLSVVLAPTAKGDQVLIKVFGVNHPWNNKVLKAALRRGSQNRVEYVIKHEGADFVLMREGVEQGAFLTLPGLGDLRLSFDRPAALEVQPEHLMTGLENQQGAK